MTEQKSVAVEEIVFNSTDAERVGIDSKVNETYKKNAIISHEDKEITIKEEFACNHDSISEMSQDGSQVVDKSSEDEKQNFDWNHVLSPLRNRNEQSGTILTGHKKQVMVAEDIGIDKCNMQASAKDQSTKHLRRLKRKNEPIENQILPEDNLEIIMEISECINIKIPKSEQSFVSTPGSASHSINTNTSVQQNSKKLILSGTANSKGSKFAKKVFICDICNKSFTQKTTLILHIHNHPEMFYCTYCNYKSFRKTCVKTHINATHTKSEVFSCSECDFKTYTKSNFFRHVAKHTKSNSLKCQHCSYKTYRKSLFEQHVNTNHTKKEIFNCPHCNYKSYRKQSLQQHLNARHTNREFFNCPYCSYRPYQKAELEKHVNAKHTKSFYYFCAQCNYKSYFKSSLVRHMNNKHRESMKVSIES